MDAEDGVPLDQYTVRAVLSAHPSVYIPFARRKYRDVPNMLVESDTELVIEGFERSGNTFAVVAFETAQPRPVKTAHHLHAAAQVVSAVRMGVPTLLLIRPPEGQPVVADDPQARYHREAGTVGMDTLLWPPARPS